MQGASSGSRGELHAAKFVSSEPNSTPALSRIALTRSAGAVSDRVLAPRKHCSILDRSTIAETASHNSVPWRPCSCVQMSCAGKGEIGRVWLTHRTSVNRASHGVNQVPDQQAFKFVAAVNRQHQLSSIA